MEKELSWAPKRTACLRQQEFPPMSSLRKRLETCRSLIAPRQLSQHAAQGTPPRGRPKGCIRMVCRRQTKGHFRAAKRAAGTRQSPRAVSCCTESASRTGPPLWQLEYAPPPAKDIGETRTS